MRSEQSQTPLNQRAFKRIAKEVSTWSQIIFDSYNRASIKQTSLSWLLETSLGCSLILQPDPLVP